MRARITTSAEQNCGVEEQMYELLEQYFRTNNKMESRDVVDKYAMNEICQKCSKCLVKVLRHLKRSFWMV